ncbi:MAG: large subunit ribosomal protein L35, partial [Yoonia sp.]
HGMIKRSNKFLRNARGTTTLCKADEGIIKPMMPYAR